MTADAMMMNPAPQPQQIPGAEQSGVPQGPIAQAGADRDFAAFQEIFKAQAAPPAAQPAPVKGAGPTDASNNLVSGMVKWLDGQAGHLQSNWGDISRELKQMVQKPHNSPADSVRIMMKMVGFEQNVSLTTAVAQNTTRSVETLMKGS